MSIFHLKYRSDIDGLRCIAVMSVIGFHLFPKIFKGGFVGVDIFFVISGYLISSIILNNIKRDNFSILNFYSRRIKRIFPALIAIMLFCIIYGWFVLLPIEYSKLGKHTASAAIFISNFIFWKESGYFDQASELKPLLHLWSLSIEEQFYLFYPILLYFTLKKRWNVFKLILGITVFSFIFNVIRVTGHPKSTFYLPITRLWEFTFGAILACTILYKQQIYSLALTKYIQRLDFLRIDALISKNLRSLLGIILIVSSIFFLDKDKNFPGWWALLPTLGAVFLISAGSDAYINKKILSRKIFVWIGLISYSLYLWHWSLFSFVNIIYAQNVSCKIRIIIVLVTFILSWLTYILVEKPFRYSKKKITPIFLLGIMIVICFIGGGIYKKIIPSFSSRNSYLVEIERVKEDWDSPGKNLRRVKYFKYWKEVHEWKRTENKKVLFFGDSNMQQYAPAINRIIEQNPVNTRNIVFITCGGCMPIPRVSVTAHLLCPDFIKAGLNLANSKEVDTIVLVSHWFHHLLDEQHYYENDKHKKMLIKKGSKGYEAAHKQLELMMQRWHDLNKKVYLVLSIPVGKTNNLIKRDLMGNFVVVKGESIDKIQMLAKYGFINERLKKIAQRTGAIVIDPLEYLCDEKICPIIMKNGKLIYKDQHHFAASFVRDNVHFLDEILLKQ